MVNNIYYESIASKYRDKVAKRSQVPLINHIDQGLIILDSLGSTQQTKNAFCVHPMFQSDEDFVENFYILDKFGSFEVALVMEYRSVANEYLSDRIINSISDIRLSPLRAVNEMLLADKIQNRKDFLIYHYGTHPDSRELKLYFDNFLYRLKDNLGITWKKIEELHDKISNH